MDDGGGGLSFDGNGEDGRVAELDRLSDFRLVTDASSSWRSPPWNVEPLVMVRSLPERVLISSSMVDVPTVVIPVLIP